MNHIDLVLSKKYYTYPKTVNILVLSTNDDKWFMLKTVFKHLPTSIIN